MSFSAVIWRARRSASRSTLSANLAAVSSTTIASISNDNRLDLFLNSPRARRKFDLVLLHFGQIFGPTEGRIGQVGERRKSLSNSTQRCQARQSIQEALNLVHS